MKLRLLLVLVALVVLSTVVPAQGYIPVWRGQEQLRIYDAQHKTVGNEVYGVFDYSEVADAITSSTDFTVTGIVTATTFSGSGGSIDHGSLADLLADDHTQYFELDGSDTMSGDFLMTQDLAPSGARAEMVSIARSCTGTAQNGDGIGLTFTGEDDAGVATVMGYVDFLMTQVTNNAEQSALVVTTRNGATLAEAFRIDHLKSITVAGDANIQGGDLTVGADDSTDDNLNLGAATFKWDEAGAEVELNQMLNIGDDLRVGIDDTSNDTLYLGGGSVIWSESNARWQFSQGIYFYGNMEARGTIYPYTDIAFDLGSSTKLWRDIYTKGRFTTATAGELTLDSAGAITVTGSFHTVDAYCDTATDSVVTINGGIDGARVTFMAANDGRDIVFDTGAGAAGGVECGVDRTLDSQYDTISFVYNLALTKWCMTSFCDN